MLFKKIIDSSSWRKPAMLSRPTPAASICLSCQLRLLRTPSPFFFSPRRHNPKTARVFQLRRVSNARPNLKSSHEYLDEESHESKPSSNIERENSKVPIRLIASGRVHGRPGQEVREESRTLDIKTLGRRSEVIVLRDAHRDWGTIAPKYAPSIKPSNDDIDILATVAAERGLIGQKEVAANIEGYKPQNTTVPMSQDEFRRIRTEMEQGFTVGQLRRYVKAYLAREATSGREKVVMGGTTKVDAGASEVMKPRENGLISKTSWYADRTKENHPFLEDPLRGYSTIQHTTKQLAVLQILRTCWKIDVKEVVTSIGELELYINGPEFALLTNASILHLEPIISRLRHYEDEKIEAFRKRAVLRITASRPRAHRIAQDIEKNLLNRIQKLDLKVDVWNTTDAKIPRTSDVPLDAIAVHEVAKMTGTNIVRTSRMEGTIYCVNNFPDSKLASPAEIAKRLLTAYWTSFNTNPTRLGLLQTARSSDAEALVRHDDLDGLPWYNRLRQWVRRTSSASKDSGNDAESSSRTQSKSIKFKIDDSSSKGDATASTAENSNSDDHIPQTLLKTIDRTPRKKGFDQGIFWSEKYSASSQIVLGQVLHEKPNAAPIETAPNRDDFLISKNQTFLTAVPNLPTLMQSLKSNGDGIPPTVLEAVIMRFEPALPGGYGWKDPGGRRAFKAYPPVEMRFAIDQVNNLTRNLILKDVYAVVETRTSDVMLPNRPVDLRFQQRIMSHVRKFRSALPAAITEFLNASQLNLATGIKTPASLTLAMDTHLYSHRRDRKFIRGTTDIEYLFSGMDMRKQMQFDFNGWTLMCADISSGKAGGKRREIRLRPILTGEKVVTDADFIRTGFELADAVGAIRSESISLPDIGEVEWRSLGARIRSGALDKISPERWYFHDRIFPERDSNDLAVGEKSEEGLEEEPEERSEKELENEPTEEQEGKLEDEQKDEPAENLGEESKDEPKQDLEGEPEEQLGQDLKDELMEEVEEEPKGKIEQEPKDEPRDEPKDELKDEPKEEPEEKLEQEAEEKSGDESLAESREEPEENSDDKPTEESKEETQGKSEDGSK